MELGSELGVLEGLALGFPLGISDGLALGMRLGPPDGFELGLVLGCPDGLELGSELGVLEGLALGFPVPALIFVTSFVGLNVVGILVGVRLMQPFTKRQILPLPDFFPVEMVSDGSVLHLRLNLIWIFVLLVKAARVDISQHDS